MVWEMKGAKIKQVYKIAELQNRKLHDIGEWTAWGNSNEWPSVHVPTASSVCQPKVMFMKTKLGTASTLEWECHGARGGGAFTISRMVPSVHLRLQPLIVPVVAKVRLIENIRATSGTCIALENFPLTLHAKGLDAVKKKKALRKM